MTSPVERIAKILREHRDPIEYGGYDDRPCCRDAADHDEHVAPLVLAALLALMYEQMEPDLEALRSFDDIPGMDGYAARYLDEVKAMFLGPWVSQSGDNQ